MKNKIKAILSSIRFIFYKHNFIAYGKGIHINHVCHFYSHSIILGNNVNFNGITIKGKGNVTIGDNFHSGRDCFIITSYHNYEGSKIPYDSTTIDKDVIIEDNVWIGDKVIILGGITVKEGSIIQAGSVVVKDVAKYQIVGGNPAQPFKSRDIDHYLMLKEKGQFF